MIKLIPLFLVLSSNVIAADYTGSRFNDVWLQVRSDPYEKLPMTKVSYGSLLKGRIQKAAKRTISSREDLLSHFDKLAHPNGVCFKGVWNISEENPYGGYFKQESEGLILVRASVAMSETKKGSYRAFGFAGKLFSTLDDEEIVETANFFTINDLGGTKDEHFTDVTLSNAPPTTFNWSIVGSFFYAMKLLSAFKAADSDPNVRQVYEISELGEEDPSTVRTPRWMAIRAQEKQTVDQADFRDELSLDNRDENLIFDILVADREDSDASKNWKAIGTIELDESVASESCDHRLHFHHPKWKKLKY